MPPDLRALARWDGSLRSVFIERVVTFPLVIGSVGADLFDLYRNVIEQIRQRFGVADIVCTGHDADDFQRRFIRAEMEFAPGSAFPDAMLADLPFAFAVNLDAGRIDDQMDRLG